MVVRLTDAGTTTVRDLAVPFEIGLPTFLKQQRVLEASGRIAAVRFQPDAHYLESVMQKTPTRIVQFPVGQGLDRATIASVLQPEAAEGGPSDAQGMAAAAAELADRTHRSIWTAVLSAMLVK